MISGLVAAYHAIRRLAKDLLIYISETARAPKTRRVLSVFCGEVAVLVAVFPVLETVIQSHPQTTDVVKDKALQDAAANHLGTVSEWSGAIALAFLLAAIIIAVEED